ncbi:hypothetical protein QBC46DRAFT_262379 [Diplogelasinospora grovesii]|uniref:Uncharacterized protein n=1 Tax=Diplogelasinospora grovesii TaxID=303347 RepID=A0AAN6N6K5_9PEZI|nr:hypothetical protein QBC46DRAFT_262379 [Diplogelasinospora grovesii]
MGQQQQSQQPLLPPRPATLSAQLSTQHERLILELLPFKDAPQFHEWLNGVYVRGSWHEFLQDFLAQNPLAPEPEKTKTAQLAKDAISSRNPKFLLYHPDKEGWTAEDHHVRFIVTVISDNLGLKNSLWSNSDFSRRGLEIAKSIYEVLSFLRATQLVLSGAGAANASPPRYEDQLLN